MDQLTNQILKEAVTKTEALNMLREKREAEIKEKYQASEKGLRGQKGDIEEKFAAAEKEKPKQ